MLREQNVLELRGERRRPLLKYSIFASNLIILMAGVSLLSTGVWVRSDERFRDFLSERYRNAIAAEWWNAPTLYICSWLLIVLGALMVVVAVFLGCCGSARESQCLLLLYAVCLIALFIATIAIGTYLIIKKDGIENELGDALLYMVQHYYQGAGVVTETLDALQTAFHCCGDSGCEDFYDLHLGLPRSCTECDACRYRIFKALRDGFTVLTVVFIIVLLAELAALLLSLYLFCWLQDPASKQLRSYVQMSPAMTRLPAYASDGPKRVPLETRRPPPPHAIGGTAAAPRYATAAPGSRPTAVRQQADGDQRRFYAQTAAAQPPPPYNGRYVQRAA